MIHLDSKCPACDLAAKQKRYGDRLIYTAGSFYVRLPTPIGPDISPDHWLEDGSPLRLIASYGEDGAAPLHNHHIGYERKYDTEEMDDGNKTTAIHSAQRSTGTTVRNIQA